MAALNLTTMPHSLKSNSSPSTLYLFVQTHTRGGQGQRRYLFADARNPLSDNTKAGEATDINHNYSERETSVNFPHTELASD